MNRKEFIPEGEVATRQRKVFKQAMMREKQKEADATFLRWFRENRIDKRDPRS
tara:strand:- start:1680 stop:1838 length:159 start_codon:yes stop_codon:yes gene_type:complete